MNTEEVIFLCVDRLHNLEGSSQIEKINLLKLKFGTENHPMKMMDMSPHS